MGAVVSVILIIAITSFLSLYFGQGSAQAAAGSALDDIRFTIIDYKEPSLAGGFIEKDLKIVGMNAGELYINENGNSVRDDGEVVRPASCGSRSKSCIFLCESENCAKAIGDPYVSNTIKNIIAKDGTSTKEIKYPDADNIKYKDGSPGYYLILEGETKFTILIEIKDDNMYIEKVS